MWSEFHTFCECSVRSLLAAEEVENLPALTYTYRLASTPSSIIHADATAVTFQVVATGTAIVTAGVKQHPVCAGVAAASDEWQGVASHL